MTNGNGNSDDQNQKTQKILNPQIKLREYSRALRAIAGEPCLWMMENFNRGKSCRDGSPLEAIETDEEDPIFDSENWCSVCIASAVLDYTRGWE